MNLWKLKREFLEHCEIEKGQSVLTIDNYGRYIDRFLTWLDNQNPLGSDPNVISGQPRASEGENSRSHVSCGANNSESEKHLDNLKPEMITDESVRQYRLYINRLRDSHGQELKATTQNHHILALRAFLRYLLSRGIAVLPPEKIVLSKTGDREINFLTEEEYQRFLNAPDAAKPDGLRDKAMLEVLFSTGMRISELAAANLGQINFQQGEMAVLGKGKKLRVVFLSDIALIWLTRYLKTRGVFKNYGIVKEQKSTGDKEDLSAANKKDTLHQFISPGTGANSLEDLKQLIILDTCKNDPLFISSRGNRLNARAAERSVKKYSKLAGISKEITPHTLRHTFATDMLAAGADIRSVQSLLGHSNLSTTQVYTHVTDKHLREIHKKFHGLNNKDSE